MNYYVYAYLRNDGSPYYIGKGTKNRAWSKGKGEVGKPTDNSRIIIVEDNLTNVGALAIERRLIRWYGRKDLGTGILRNQTDGGDGGKGATKGNTLSKETKNKISIAHKGKKRGSMSLESKQKLSDSMKGKNLGKTKSIEAKIKISLSLRNRKRRPHTEETKQKLREINLGKHRAPFTDEHKHRISAALKGKPKDRDAVEKQRQKILGRTPSSEERKAYLAAMEKGKTTCEHCGKTATLGNYRRWHGINCRSKQH